LPSVEVVLQRIAGTGARVIGIVAAPLPACKAWAESVGGVAYPLLADAEPVTGAVSALYGVWQTQGHVQAATFVVNREGLVRYIDRHGSATGPNVDALLVVLSQP
jgi:alkyl hydroperoxide reductase subunit AhpC